MTCESLEAPAATQMQASSPRLQNDYAPAWHQHSLEQHPGRPTNNLLASPIPELAPASSTASSLHDTAAAHRRAAQLSASALTAMQHPCHSAKPIE